MTKIKHDNDMINHTGATYVEYDTKLLWPIRLGVDYDENQIGQWRDW